MRIECAYCPQRRALGKTLRGIEGQELRVTGIEGQIPIKSLNFNDPGRTVAVGIGLVLQMGRA